MIRVGVDIGGTFTDFVIWRDDVPGAAIASFKVPSTPPDFETGFITGFEELLARMPIGPRESVIVMHGTTVSTNAVIERSQDPVALFVTRGFRDILELQRLRLADPINLLGGRRAPLISRDLVFEIDERVGSAGEVVIPLDSDSIDRAVATIRAKGIRGVAVALLHSYAFPAHEQAVAARIRARAPELDVCLSSDVWPRIGEYERAVNALLNVYVRPKLGSYLGAIESWLADRVPGAQLFITRSNGGAMAAAEARAFPVHTLLSGPASGVTAAQLLARAEPERQFLTMDMGGTSTDISLIRAGQPTVARETEVGDFPLTMPVTGIEAIGAGGGSIARLDGRVLRVGPESAGALPGPACFSRGGTRPTITDAYLVCGYLDPETFLGGTMPLDRTAAEAAFAPLAKALGGKSVAGAADAAIAVATSNMIAAVLPYLARNGVDPEEVTLVTFGGNGALHGPLLAAEIGIPRVVVPAIPSVFCALGGIVTELVHDVVAIVQTETMDDAALAAALASLEGEARAWLARQIAPERIVAIAIEYVADMRYAGQSFQIAVPLAISGPEAADTDAAAAAFHAEHRRLHAHADPTAAVEFIELRVRIRGGLAAPTGDTPPPAGSSVAPAPVTRRTLEIDGIAYPDCPVHDRTRLSAGVRIPGPAIISQSDATVLVPPAFTAEIRTGGEIVLTKEA